MKILLVSGFLGAGKTTFIKELAKNIKKFKKNIENLKNIRKNIKFEMKGYNYEDFIS